MPLVLDGTNGVSGVDGTASNPAIEGTDSNTGIFYPAADTVAIGTGGTERLRVDSAGNTGFGVTPPTSTDAGNITIKNGSTLNWSAGSANITSNATFNSSWKYITTAPATRYRTDSGQHIWDNAPSGTAGNAITFTQAMTLDANGNLGIGTTSPNAKLDIVATTNTIRLGRSTSSYATIDSNSNAGSLNLNADVGNTASGGSMTFTFAGTERARITSGGELLVGTTTAGATPSQGFVFTPSSDSLMRIGHANGTGSGSNYVLFGYNSTNIGAIYQSGTTAVVYSTSSDYRLKDNIQPMQNALAVVTQLKPVTYKWKSDGTDGQGFIAHELQEFFPEAVSYEKDAVDKDGNPVYQGIDTSFLVATLTAAIQELNAKVEAQAAEIAALKAQP